MGDTVPLDGSSWMPAVIFFVSGTEVTKEFCTCAYSAVLRMRAYALKKQCARSRPFESVRMCIICAHAGFFTWHSCSDTRPFACA